MWEEIVVESGVGVERGSERAWGGRGARLAREGWRGARAWSGAGEGDRMDAGWRTDGVWWQEAAGWVGGWVDGCLGGVDRTGNKWRTRWGRMGGGRMDAAGKDGWRTDGWVDGCMCRQAY